MGCNSGKVSAPKSASETARAENTLLGSSGQKEAVKEDAGVPADLVCFLKTIFDGVWSKGVIAGDSLTWADGTVSSIRVDEVSKVLEVNFKGTLVTGGLYGEGDKIHWSDGDIWDRCEVDAGEIPKLSDDFMSQVTFHPTEAEMPLGNSQAFVEIPLADGPESIDLVAHTSQANKHGEVVQFAGAPLPSIPEAAKRSPEKTRDQVDAEFKQVEATAKAFLAHTSDSQPPAGSTRPSSSDNERMFADSRKASAIQSEPRKEKTMCCC